jgi:hypothetical protein
MSRRLPLVVARIGPKVVFVLAAFAVLCLAILRQPSWALHDFDQPFYTTIAYDLDRHGVFSNGIFDGAQDPAAPPPPGMFFGPVYPVLVLAAMKIDPRFARAVRCAVEADREDRDDFSCEAYARPMRIMHALLLAFGVLAVALAGELMFRKRAMFWLTGALATAALAAESDIFSYVMTESVSFALYSIFALALLRAWTSARLPYFILAGSLLGLMCLTRPSFLAVFPVAVGLSLLWGYLVPRRRSTGLRVLAFMLAFSVVLGAWATRNAISVGKFGLTQEYGAVTLIERFAYNDMTAREFFLAFPYCTPGLGELAFDKVYGNDSMHRFVFHTPGSFFHVGRDRRDALVEEHGRVDPLITGIVLDEMRANWWRHLLVGIPLGWCGMWAGWVVSLALLPLFGWACVRALRRSQPLLLFYAAPAVAMLGLHGLVANHYTRYNLILIGPFAIGAAWMIDSWVRHRRSRALAA